MFDQVSTNDLYGSPDSGSQQLGQQNFASLFPGADAAYKNQDGTYTVIKYGQGGDGGFDFRATGTIGPNGQPQVGQFQRNDVASTGQMAGQFGLGAAALFGGLGALGTGPFGGAGAVGGAGGAGAAGAVDPVAGYLATGGAEGSLAGSGFTGAIPGAAGAVPAAAGAIPGVGAVGAASGGGGILGTIGQTLGLSNGQVLSGAGNLLNAGLGVWSSNKAADAQRDAAAQSNALLEKMYDTTRADNLPALQARNAGLTGYQNLLKDPSSVTSDPGYQFGMKQGIAAYDNSGAARGMRLSGAQAKGLTRFGQDYAGTKYDNSLTRYGNLAGLGQVGAGTIANAASNYGNQASQNITGAGNAAASGYIGGANAVAGGVNNFLRSYQDSELLRRIGMGG